MTTVLINTSYIFITHTVCVFFFFSGQSDWFSMRSVFSYLFPRAMVTLSWVAEYIPIFVANYHKYISFFRLGSILSKDVSHYLKPINNLLILYFLPQINSVDRKILVSEWICISNSVITLIDKRPKRGSCVIRPFSFVLNQKLKIDVNFRLSFFIIKNTKVLNWNFLFFPFW